MYADRILKVANSFLEKAGQFWSDDKDSLYSTMEKDIEDELDREASLGEQEAKKVNGIKWMLEKIKQIDKNDTEYLSILGRALLYDAQKLTGAAITRRFGEQLLQVISNVEKEPSLPTPGAGAESLGEKLKEQAPTYTGYEEYEI